jgi:hypothetical protein
LGEALAHFGFRVAGFDLLLHPTALVGYFYEKFSHASSKYQAVTISLAPKTPAFTVT